MTAIREPGRINDNTTLVDIGLFGVAGVGAVYLLRGEETLLIDCGLGARGLGARREPTRIVRTLKQLNSFPPDYVVFTHSHYDHCQGIHHVRREARKEGKNIKVMASEKAIPLLEDQSWQKVFDAGHFDDIRDVNPIREGETIDLKGLSLRVIDVPGHTKDSIALYDEKHKNLFVGDSIGDKSGDRAFLPPFVGVSWDTDAFHNSIRKLRQIEFNGIGLAHFGFIYGEEAKNVLDEALTTFEKSWNIYESAEKLGRLNDDNYLVEELWEKLALVDPKLRPIDSRIAFLLGMMNIPRTLTGKRPYTAADILVRGMAKWLRDGYKTYKKR